VNFFWPAYNRFSSDKRVRIIFGNVCFGSIWAFLKLISVHDRVMGVDEMQDGAGFIFRPAQVFT
jgi:hypothetical protein